LDDAAQELAEKVAKILNYFGHQDETIATAKKRCGVDGDKNQPPKNLKIAVKKEEAKDTFLFAQIFNAAPNKIPKNLMFERVI
jgi:hypothetical protein